MINDETIEFYNDAELYKEFGKNKGVDYHTDDDTCKLQEAVKVQWKPNRPEDQSQEGIGKYPPKIV